MRGQTNENAEGEWFMEMKMGKAMSSEIEMRRLDCEVIKDVSHHKCGCGILLMYT